VVETERASCGRSRINGGRGWERREKKAPRVRTNPRNNRNDRTVGEGGAKGREREGGWRSILREPREKKDLRKEAGP